MQLWKKLLVLVAFPSQCGWILAPGETSRGVFRVRSSAQDTACWLPQLVQTRSTDCSSGGFPRLFGLVTSGSTVSVVQSLAAIEISATPYRKQTPHTGLSRPVDNSPYQSWVTPTANSSASSRCQLQGALLAASSASQGSVHCHPGREGLLPGSVVLQFSYHQPY